MHISAGLAAELASLTQTLDDPAADINLTLQRLAAAATSAVTSFLGLTVSVTDGDDQQLTVTAMTTPRTPKIAASLRLILPFENSQPPVSVPPAAGGAGAALVLYAGTPGAYVDLAADITWLCRGNNAAVRLDQDLTAGDADAAGGLENIVILNQAVGVLLARGYLPTQARQQLNIWAEQQQVDRLSVARHVLTTLTRPGC